MVALDVSTSDTHTHTHTNTHTHTHTHTLRTHAHITSAAAAAAMYKGTGLAHRLTDVALASMREDETIARVPENQCCVGT
jgi:hypothetical protein